MKNTLLALSGFLLTLTLVHAAPIPPGPSAAYINNSAAAQTAVFNVGTGTVRGTLTAGTVIATTLSVPTINATLAGNGAAITALNASNLASGTIPAAVSFRGVPVGVAYGGTGQDLSAVTQGKIPYFSATGVFNVTGAGVANQVLASGGPAGSPAFTGAPVVLGTNITGIPLSSLLPGTLSASIVASSISPTAVTPGTYGGPAQIPSITVGTDGRITSASQSSLTTGSALIDSENYFSRFNKFLSSVTVVGNFYAPGANITGVVYSTAALQSQVNLIAADTGTLTTNLAAEVVRALAAEASIKVSTGVLTTGLAAELIARAAGDAALAIATGTLTTNLAAEGVARSTTDAAIILSTGATALGLANELITRAAADAAIGVTTAAIAASDALKLPLAGGTLTGQLRGTSAVFSASITGSTGTFTGSALSVGASTFSVLSGRVGVFTASPLSNLDVKGSMGHNLTEVTSTYTATDTDYLIEATTDINHGFTVTLPLLSGRLGRVYEIKSGGPGAINVVGSSGELIDSLNSFKLSMERNSVSVQANSSRWIVTGGRTLPPCPHGVFLTTTTVVSTSTTAGYALVYSTSPDIEGISFANNTSKIYFPEVGDYLINVSVEFLNTGAGAKTGNIWFKQNGVVVPNSNTQIVVNTAGDIRVVDVPFIMDAATGLGEYFEVMWSVDNVALTLPTIPASSTGGLVIPLTPAAIISVNKIGR